MTHVLSATFPENRKETTIALNTEQRTVQVDGKPCRLTQQEYLLLLELARNPGSTHTRDRLLCNAWGFLSPGKTRTVDVHIQRLRRKLGAQLIQTVHGQGYRMCAQRVAPAI
ncbi:MAG: winged helix-turn-helix transcriptional regulator [Clostridiales bacterium]|nr:winged helix-turn-helix transcriptional regulator [Clostridiales bacterium]